MTPMLNFRLSPQTVNELDAIVDHLAEQGLGDKRADAVRWAIRQAFLRLKKLGKKSEKTDK